MSDERIYIKLPKQKIKTLKVPGKFRKPKDSEGKEDSREKTFPEWLEAMGKPGGETRYIKTQGGKKKEATPEDADVMYFTLPNDGLSGPEIAEERKAFAALLRSQKMDWEDVLISPQEMREETTIEFEREPIPEAEAPGKPQDKGNR